MDFSSKTALLTGGGSGIGRASAERFAREGADVAVVDIDEEGAEETVDRIEAADGGRAEAIQADVTDSAAVERMIAEIIDRFGHLDVLHNNAGRLHQPVPVEELEESTWDEVHGLNLKGVFLGIKHAVPHLREGEGVIVNTASTAAIRPRPGTAAYASSKGGVVTLTKQLARELAEDGIRVNAVCPVATDTPLLSALEGSEEAETDIEDIVATIPLGRLVEPEEVAATVAFLASDEASMISGSALEVDGARDV